MWTHCIQKGNSSNIHSVIKYFTTRLSGDNTTTQVCAHCAFVFKNIQNFVDLDACKLLFVLNSYKSAIKKIGNKNHKSLIFWSDLNQTILNTILNTVHNLPISPPE